MSVKLREWIIGPAGGLQATVCNLGASLTGLFLPIVGRNINVVLRYPDLDHYSNDAYFLGASIGRYANRIANGRFGLHGEEYQLSLNENRHHLHGGEVGFSKCVWQLREFSSNRLVLCLESPDGDQGFPGKLIVKALFFIEANSLTISYEASSDADTVVNLCNHAYFNLHGDNSSSHQHLLSIAASHYTPVNEELIPDGNLRAVSATPFDFRCQRQIGADYDHNFALDVQAKKMPAAVLQSPLSGITMRLYTDQPGLQLYTGQHLAAPFLPRQGLCLEPQRFPDAPNQIHFPSSLLKAGEIYRAKSCYVFD